MVSLFHLFSFKSLFLMSCEPRRRQKISNWRDIHWKLVWTILTAASLKHCTVWRKEFIENRSIAGLQTVPAESLQIADSQIHLLALFCTARESQSLKCCYIPEHKTNIQDAYQRKPRESLQWSQRVHEVEVFYKAIGHSGLSGVCVQRIMSAWL